jgi:hypothetical protein
MAVMYGDRIYYNKKSKEVPLHAMEALGGEDV